MKYLIWHKFTYLLLIIANIILTLLWLRNISEPVSAFPYFYIVPWQAIADCILLINSTFFLLTHIFLFSKILNRKLTSKLFWLERMFSIGRILMALFMIVPVLNSGIISISPVGRSLWFPFFGLNSYTMTGYWGYIFIIVILIVSIEAGYFSRLSSQKEHLRGNHIPSKIKGANPILSKRDTLSNELHKTYSDHLLIRVISISGAISFTCMFFFLIVLTFGKPGSPLVIKEIKLWAKHYPNRGYQLSIPRGYLKTPELKDADLGGLLKTRKSDFYLNLRAPYPSVLDFTISKNQKKIQKTNKKIQEWIRISVEHDFYPNHLKLGKSPRNDNGRFVMKNIRRQGYKEVPLVESIEQSEKVIKLVKDRTSSDGVYVITHEDKRVSIVICRYITSCKVYTTWAGELTIGYTIDRKQLFGIVELDQSIEELINSFNPRLINKGE